VAQTPDFRDGSSNQAQAYTKPGSYIGVALADLDSERARSLGLDEAKGVEVVHIEPGSPAEKAALKTGDVLLTYNGENVLGAEQLGRLVWETPPGRKVKIQLWREGHPVTVTVLTGARKTVADHPGMAMGIPDVPNLMPDLPSAMLMWKSGILGIYCESVDSQLAEYFGVKQGVLVRFVFSGSAAQRAGLKAGDVLTKVGDHVVATPRDVTAALQLEATPGKPVSIVLTRDRKETALKVMPEQVSAPYGMRPSPPRNQ
jgi:serine protease Do